MAEFDIWTPSNPKPPRSQVTDATRIAKAFGYRYTFELRKLGMGTIMRHTLTRNPEEMSQDESARVSITPTLGGAYVQDFGQGLIPITLSGTTGYRKRTTSEGLLTDGFQEFLIFRTRIYRDFIRSNDPDLQLFWYNWEDDEYYQIQPQNFRLQRSKSQPLLYRYEFRFTCIEQITSGITTFKKALQDAVTDPATGAIRSSVDRTLSIMGDYLAKQFK